MTRRPYILVDIDHTVSNSFWRDPMIGVNSWDEYHAASVHDQPIHDIKYLLDAVYVAGAFTPLGFTARPAKWRKLTADWLLVNQIRFDEILMRPDDDYRPAPEIKMALAVERFGNNIAKDVAFIMDDREDVCAAFRAIGVTAMQIHARAR